MHPIDLDHLRSKSYFDDAVFVIEKLGLTELTTLKCNFNPHLIMLFYATLVIMPNPQKTMKWMSGEHYCQADFSRFVIRLKHIYNFLCSMLVFTPFA
jgi:hypothetical protein